MRLKMTTWCQDEVPIWSHVFTAVIRHEVMLHSTVAHSIKDDVTGPTHVTLPSPVACQFSMLALSHLP